MAIYTFFNPQTNEYKDIIMSMNDKHEYIDNNGFKWERIFHIPNTSIDTICDPHSAKDFLKVTKKMRTYGDVLDKSAELSEKRGGKDDPIKSKYYDDYSKKRNGTLHPDKVRESSIKTLDKLGVSVTE